MTAQPTHVQAMQIVLRVNIAETMELALLIVVVMTIAQVENAARLENVLLAHNLMQVYL